MFTGIVEAVGRVVSTEKRGRDVRLVIETPPAFIKGANLGDSIACSGVCLTVVAKTKNLFTADVSIETLDATTAGRWKAGTPLNLEPALTLAKPLGGHLVLGHVDGVGRLTSRKADARSVRMVFSAPKSLIRYISRKGSVCIDGVSLTVNEAGARGFGVNIIPHTLSHTSLGALSPGDPVNLEVDLIARYLERLLKK